MKFKLILERYIEISEESLERSKISAQEYRSGKVKSVKEFNISLKNKRKPA